MNTSEYELVQQWRQCQFRQAPFIFSRDKILDNLRDDRRVVNIHKTFDGFIDSPDFGTTTKQLHLGLLPMPYNGNLSRSDIFILLLNPGFGAGDYYVEQHSPEYRAAILRNIYQENEAEDYPFFFLDPRFSWTGGGIWWQDKLRDITRALVSHHSMSYQNALRYLSRRVSCLELVPYHSKTYGVTAKVSSTLTSTQLVREFVQKVLLPRAEQDEITIVVTRKALEWRLTESKNVIVYGGSEARAAHLTLGDKNRKPSRGGKAIARRLGLSIRNMDESEPEGDSIYAL